MKPFTPLLALVCAALFAAPLSAQNESASPAVGSSPVAAPAASGQPANEDMIKQAIEMSKLNENHKLLSSLDGTWNYTLKFWMNGDSSGKADESTGTAVRKSVMGGRYVVMDVTGKTKMPGADGKMKEVEFQGHETDGYDNAKKKFVATWMDNMGTGIMMSEGTYDPTTKTFTYTGEMEPMPGMKEQVREVLKITDKDHMDFQYYENRGGQEMKTMEINYTRAK